MSKEEYSTILSEVKHQSVQKIMESQKSWPSELFHYTNATGVHGILTSKALFLTNLRYLNDPNELTYVFSLAQKCLEIQRADWVKHPNGDIIWDSVYSFLGHVISDYHESDLVFQNDEHDYYVCSLSESADSLDQWRAYGDDGLGTCIGLNPNKLANVRWGLPSISITPPNTTFLVKMIYDEKEQMKTINEFLKVVLEMVENADEGDNVADVMWVTNEELSELLHELRFIFKHKAYEQEREWRLVMIDNHNYLTGEFFDWLSDPERHPKPKEAVKLITPAVKTRVRNHEIIPYLIFKIENEDSSDDDELFDGSASPPISQFILGPRSNQMNASLSLIHLLTELGYGHYPKMDKSSAPYRV